MKKETPLEHVEAEKFVNYLRLLQRTGKILLFAHLINEFPFGLKMIGMIQKYKSEGWVKGVPDYLIVTAKHPKIVFIELKRVKGSVIREDQIEWIKGLRAAGCEAMICLGHQAAEIYLESFL